jgi:hypothetical protein
MPASQTVCYTDNEYVELSINAIDEPDDVYFTHQTPEFELVMKNTTERHIKNLDRKSGLRWVLALGPGESHVLAGGDIDLSIGPGDTQRETISPGLLGYEGNAVLGVTGVSLSGSHNSGEGPIRYGKGPNDALKHILYTFTIWDRSHYEAVHEQPKRLQKWIIGFGGLTAFLAALQLSILLGFLPV